MIRRRKKSRKIRGRKTGRGSGKRARGAGNRGGRGNAGINKRAAHKRTLLIKHPELSSREKGFVSVKQKMKRHVKSINVGQVDKLSVKLGSEIDLNKLGYEKLLGSGKVTNKLIVKVKSFTESAKQKIEAAGGKLIT
jgi:large subunit ribosomal protein L15